MTMTKYLLSASIFMPASPVRPSRDVGDASAGEAPRPPVGSVAVLELRGAVFGGLNDVHSVFVSGVHGESTPCDFSPETGFHLHRCLCAILAIEPEGCDSGSRHWWYRFDFSQRACLHHRTRRQPVLSDTGHAHRRAGNWHADRRTGGAAGCPPKREVPPDAAAKAHPRRRTPRPHHRRTAHQRRTRRRRTTTTPGLARRHLRTATVLVRCPDQSAVGFVSGPVSRWMLETVSERIIGKVPSEFR